MISEVVLFIPEGKECAQIVHAEPGIRDNLLPEDVEEGFIDYLNLYRYYSEPSDMDDDHIEFGILDGDMILLKESPETLDEFISAISEYLEVEKDSIVVLSAA